MEENETTLTRNKSTVPRSVPGEKKSKHLIKRIFFKTVYVVKLFVAFVFFIIVFPVLVLCLSPFYLFRFIVYKSSALLRPDLGKIMSSRSSILGTDSIYKDPQCVIIGRVILEGKFDMEKFTELVQEAWIEGKKEDGSLEHPELRQYVTTWMGYLFWKWDKDFEIKDHVKLYTSTGKTEVETQESVDQIVADLVSLSFKRHKSPWEIVVINNYSQSATREPETDTKSVLIIRWHHSLMDGLSSYKLLSKITSLKLDMVPYSQSQAQGNSSASSNRWKTRRFLKRFLATLWFAFRAPYEAISAPIESLDRNPWHLPLSELSRKNYIFYTDGIPLKKMYELKSNYQVSFSAIVYTLITGAMRHFMKATKPREKIPKIIHAGLTFPFPQHPDKLRNHMTICTSKMPVGMEDPVRRLYFMEKHLNELKSSAVLAMSFHLVPFIGTLPLCLLRNMVHNDNTTIMLSNMPGPKEQIQFSTGQTFLDWVYSSGHGPGTVGVSIFALTYNGILKFCVVVDSALVASKSLAQELSEAIMNEVMTLESLQTCEV